MSSSTAQLTVRISAAAFMQVEKKHAGLEERWNVLTEKSAQPRNEAGVQRTRIQQLEQSHQRLSTRQQRLQDEQHSLQDDPLADTPAELQQQVEEGQARLDELSAIQQLQATQLHDTQEQLTAKNQQQQQVQGQLQRLQGRISALEFAQAALNPDKACRVVDSQQCNSTALAGCLKVSRLDWRWTVLAADLKQCRLIGGLILIECFTSGLLRLVSDSAG